MVTCLACGSTNPAGMRFCGMCGGVIEPQTSGSERRRVSVVFVDLAGFTTLTRTLDPEEVRDLADEVLTAVSGVIEDFDGHVDALRGDGLIALFGAPRSHPDDPERAVLAAARSLTTITRVGAARGQELKGRAGVNTGVVIAGAIGSGKVRSYTVMGSAVNLAARLEEAAMPGEVWVGPETYQATRHRLLFEPTGPVTLAGFPTVREAYRLVRSETQREADPYAHLTFVGREHEMAQLKRAYLEVVASGRPKELWVVGEAGRGKTRLLKEFLADLHGSATRLWIDHRPAEEFSWLTVGTQLFGLGEAEDERSARHRVQAFLDAALPGDERWHRVILRSLGLEPKEVWTRLERRRVDRSLVAWRDLIAAVAESGGGPDSVVVVVESEPRDPALNQFLELLQETDSPVLVLRTSRERTLPAGVESLHLPPLEFEESMGLLESVASPSMRLAAAALVRQVGGVPAYVLELGRALSITQEDSFSGSLASLLQARLDMIDLKPRRLLARAALAGEASWEGLLKELSDAQGDGEVGSLVAESLLVKQSGSNISGEAEYRFQSELLRNAVLRMIPFADRPHLHLRIATWLEQNAPPAFAQLTAEHFESGGSADAAYAHYLAAAGEAASAGLPQGSYELFERLLALPVRPRLLAEAALAYAQAAIAAANREVADRALARSEALLLECAEEDRAALQTVLAQLAAEAHGLPR